MTNNWVFIWSKGIWINMANARCVDIDTDIEDTPELREEYGNFKRAHGHRDKHHKISTEFHRVTVTWLNGDVETYLSCTGDIGGDDFLEEILHGKS